MFLALFASLGVWATTGHAANLVDGLKYNAADAPRDAFRNISDRSNLPPSPNFMPSPGPGYGSGPGYGYGYPGGPGYGYRYGYEAPPPYGYRERPTYVPGASARYGRAWIREIQRRLTGAGYDPGPADGLYGGGTKRAVRAYQRDHGLAVTGLPTPVLMSSLRANAPLAPLGQAAVEPPEDPPLTEDAPSTPTAAAEREEKADRIGKFDIVGITLDMPFDEAEALVRDRMDVETVVERTSAEQTDPFFQDLRGFHSRDGKESIVLHKASPDSDEVVAVVRTVDFPAGIDTEAVKQKLIEKYGESDPTNHSRYLLWPSRQEYWACAMALGWEEVGVTEGPEPDKPRKTAILRNGVEYVQDDIVYEDLARECGPTLMADASESRLIVSLFDVGKYAERVVTQDGGVTAGSGTKPDDLEL